MDYHSTLKPLVEFTQTLTFKEEDRKIHFVRAYPEQNVILIYQGEIYNSCNGLHLVDFNKKIKKVVREIEDCIDENLISKGVEYKKDIRLIVKSLCRLHQDFFNDSGMYIGETIQINDKMDIMEMKVEGTYINYLCDKYKCEDSMISDTRKNSKPSEFYKALCSRLISLEQSLSFLYSEADSITETTTVEENLVEKLKWNGNSAQLAYIFQELANNDYFEIPRTRGNISWSKLAKYCDQYFEYDFEFSSLEKNMRNPECLVRSNRDKFVIPSLRSIS